MKVLKFGGTSVGTVESLGNVKRIVEGCAENVIVVVSALGGVTDKLISTAKQAANGDFDYLDSYRYIIDRHNAIIDGLVPDDKKQEVRGIISPLLEELGNIFKGVSLIKDLSCRTLDIIVSYGERLSSVIISYVISDATHFDSRCFIKTEAQFNKHVLDVSLTDSLIHDTFDNFTGKVAIVPGFISTDRRSGDITNL